MFHSEKSDWNDSSRHPSDVFKISYQKTVDYSQNDQLIQDTEGGFEVGFNPGGLHYKQANRASDQSIYLIPDTLDSE